MDFHLRGVTKVPFDTSSPRRRGSMDVRVSRTKRMQGQPCVYLLASGRNGTLYCGVTSHLVRRVWQHREHLVEGFTGRYGVIRLVWYEQHAMMASAIAREKRIKQWNRAWKLRLIDETNPSWRDLWPDITEEVPKPKVHGPRLRGGDGGSLRHVIPAQAGIRGRWHCRTAGRMRQSRNPGRRCRCRYQDDARKASPAGDSGEGSPLAQGQPHGVGDSGTTGITSTGTVGSALSSSM